MFDFVLENQASATAYYIVFLEIFYFFAVFLHGCV